MAGRERPEEGWGRSGVLEEKRERDENKRKRDEDERKR
jgi:hypothetical protein